MAVVEDNQNDPNSPERHIPLQGCFNFRDLGGYSASDGRMVRWHRLFRSSEIHRMTADDTSALAQLGLVTVVDVRNAEVADWTPKIAWPPHLASLYLKHHHIPLITDDPEEGLRTLQTVSHADSYLFQLRKPDFAERLVGILQILATPGSCPALLHCYAGKDRTGIVAAVLLSALGVSDEDVVRDYAQSAKYIPQLIDLWWADSDIRKEMLRLPRWTWDSRPETMEYVLSTMRREFGTMREYLLRYGADENLLSRLEEQFLAPPR